MDRRKNPRLARPMPSFIQGLRGTARGLRGDGHPRHDPPDAPPPRAPKPKAPTRALTFKTGSHQRTQHRAIILIQDRAKAASMRFRRSASFLVQLAQPTANRTFRYFEAPGDRRLALLATLARAQHAFT